MKFSLEQLKAFVTSVDQGSFSAAAKYLGKAQPAVSMLISNLEIDLNMKLFDRSTRTAKLTESGEALYRYASQVLSACDEFDAKASSLETGIEENLNVVIDSGAVPREKMFDILMQFRALYPYVELNILKSTLQNVATIVGEGKADIGVGFFLQDSPKGCYEKTIGETPFGRFVGTGHPLAEFEKVDVKTLRKHHELIIAGQQALPELFICHYGNRIWSFDDYGELMWMLRKNLGWAALPSHLVQEDIRKGEVVPLELTVIKPSFTNAQPVCAYWSISRPLKVAGSWLLEQIIELGI